MLQAQGSYSCMQVCCPGLGVSIIFAGPHRTNLCSPHGGILLIYLPDLGPSLTQTP